MKQCSGRTIKAIFISKPTLLGESYGILQDPRAMLLEPIVKQRVSAGSGVFRFRSLEQYMSKLTGCRNC